MKPVLLLAFLALGPALADQTRAAPPAADVVIAAPVAARLRATDRVAAQTPLSDDERARLCGS
jgi:hypothetical protein